MIVPSATLAGLGLILVSFITGYLTAWSPNKLLRYGASSFSFIALSIVGIYMFHIGPPIYAFGNFFPLGLALCLMSGMLVNRQHARLAAWLAERKERQLKVKANCEVCGIASTLAFLRQCTSCGRMYCYPPAPGDFRRKYLAAMGMVGLGMLSLFVGKYSVYLALGSLLLIMAGFLVRGVFLPRRMVTRVRICGTENLCERCENSGGLPVFDNNDDHDDDGEEPDWEMDWNEVFDEIGRGKFEWSPSRDRSGGRD